MNPRQVSDVHFEPDRLDVFSNWKDWMYGPDAALGERNEFQCMVTGIEGEI